ncbi:porin [Pantoea sp. 18069]|uniref:porin n=1 Tax=Pantoea sp. 18069 TaxID=2681415 RepID=UPI001359CD70|nr:porin [Pantoea sp. 18069]
MKKTITAAAAALALPMAALAQTSVAMYGIMDVSLQHLRFGSTGTRPGASLTALTSDTSRLGFRGTEDLGGGMKAYFKLETGFQADTGMQTSATAFFNRETYVGLAGAGLGSVQLGSQWAPGLLMALKVDPFMRFGVGGQYTLLQGSRGYQNRYDNAVQYISPTFGGVTARLLGAVGEGAATGSSYSGSVEYAGGPLFLGAVYDQVHATPASLGLGGDPVVSRTLSLGATYDFSVAKVGAWYQTNRVGGLSDVNGYLLGLTVPVGAGEIRASYSHRSATNASASLLAIGYGHYLSKRTQLYANVGRLSNSGVAAFRMGPATSEQAAAGLPFPGQDTTGYQFGIRHFF